MTSEGLGYIGLCYENLILRQVADWNNMRLTKLKQSFYMCFFIYSCNDSGGKDTGNGGETGSGACIIIGDA